ncbi:MAG: hypothetical protein Tp138OMZ00d2C19078261_17 [Prokaryotic dsDNA virus sp.]|mgnify:CR=1 FL=1|jgi:hypothetical protein|nr:MAG: hypothetical protein Tp138OMZ00d2C19078261_17 [Prokaryotic dsDNA virus sp.]|tara:strand:- start:16559 stop:16765 length:207 start_codon:yes stop_codon:yes gene_type:complete
MARELAVNSSAIESATYDLTSGDLVVNFHSGATTTYGNVPPDVVLELEVAPSSGRYFNQNIRGQFPEK